MNKQLYRSSRNNVIGGVCAGIAEYFEIDPTIVRLIWVLALFAGIGIIAYIVCWIVIPEKPISPFDTFQDASAAGDSYESQRNAAVNKEKGIRILGAALIVIGALFLCDRFFGWFDFSVVFPIALIAVGVYVLFAKEKRP
ncbi:PspC domain-containing protein [Dehalobacter sp. DCM]|uniref:PspC domain-containing protein n=1 Tax=Dehalobacter sp. DCM TaxID=2907827 RepID=UPI0030819DA5|nr:PspC domain-containing protein [Dehalobacter sp. DCM]